MADEIEEGAESAGETAEEERRKPLREKVETSLTSYFEVLGDEAEPSDLYELVLAEVEIPLLNVVLYHNNQNRTKAASMLGMSRGTLLTKLKRYGLM